MKPEQKILNLILAAAAIFYLALIFGASFVIKDERYFTLIDDAMISMRYAKHLAQGHGLIWNIGQAPVEGFTNLGWTLYMGLLHLFPIPASKISLAVMLTSVIILLSNIYVVYRITETLLPESKYASLLAAFITAFYFPLVFWSLRGMEVGLLILLIDLSILLAISHLTWQAVPGKDKAILVSTVLALAILVRIDAIIPAALIVLYLFLKNKRSAIIPAISVIATTLAILIFQQLYFGDFLPTTYYQKITGFATLERIRHGILVFNQFATRDTLFIFLFSFAGLFYYKLQRNREALLLLGIFLAQCAYSIYIGGDYAEPETNAANRFITQGMPALIILFSWITSRILSDLTTAQPQSALFNSKVNPAIPLAVIVLLIISGEPWFTYSIDNAPLLKADIRRVKLGLHIAENTSPEAAVAVHAAGQIPYYSERTAIDLLGLNDPVVAKGQGHGEFYPGHNKWDYDYSINQLRPDLIADNFAPLAEFMQGNKQYTKLENGIYIRNDSTLVDISGLSKEYR
jgi:arabinofuranosyltransferase